LNDREALLAAIRASDIPAAARVLDRAGSPVFFEVKGDLPLLVAAEEGASLEMVRWLVSKGFSGFNPKSTKWSPLYGAIAHDREDIAVYLIDVGSQPLNPKGIAAWRMLTTAANRGLLQVVRRLIELGVDCRERAQVFAPSEPIFHILPRVFGVYGGPRVEIARMLLDGGACPHSTTYMTGQTLLHMMPEYARCARDDEYPQGVTDVIEGIKLLVQYGATLNARDKQQRTPLMMAVQEGMPEIGRVFLGLGADSTLKDEEGLDAATMAERLGQIGFAAELRKPRQKRWWFF
jgi:ankyrin repeat protein